MLGINDVKEAIAQHVAVIRPSVLLHAEIGMPMRV